MFYSSTPTVPPNVSFNNIQRSVYNTNTNKTGSTTSKEWTTPDFRNTPSTTNLEEEEIVDAAGNDGSASIPEQVKPPNPWRKMMMMMMISLNTAFYSKLFSYMFRFRET